MLRLCKQQDKEAWIKLNRAFMLYEYQEENAWENPLNSNLEEDFHPAMESDALLFLLEEEDVIGFMNVQVFYSIWAHGKVLFLDDFFIKDRYRRKGYGEKALKELEDYGRKHGYKRIQLLSEKTNPAAGKFYRRNQYKEQELSLFIKYL